VDPRQEAKLARASTKAAAPSTVMPPPVAPVVATRMPSPSRVTETAVSGTSGAGQELSVDDYLVGGVTMFDAHTGLPSAGELSYLIPLSQVIPCF
jgi:hypothetical protein